MEKQTFSKQYNLIIVLFSLFAIVGKFIDCSPTKNEGSAKKKKP